MGIAIDPLVGRQTNTNMPINVSYHVSNICLYVGNVFVFIYGHGKCGKRKREQ